MSNNCLNRQKNAERMQLNDAVGHDNIDSDKEGGIYIIMVGKRISVRLDDEMEQKVEELRQEMKEKYKIDISVTDVIRRSIIGMYEELDLDKDTEDKN